MVESIEGSKSARPSASTSLRWVGAATVTAALVGAVVALGGGPVGTHAATHAASSGVLAVKRTFDFTGPGSSKPRFLASACTYVQGGPDQFLVDVPATATAGTPFNATITALGCDNQGNTFTDTSYTGSHIIVFSGPHNSPGGQTPSYPPSVTFALGVGTASIALVAAETTTLTATEGSVTGQSASITVSPGTATQLLFSTQPTVNQNIQATGTGSFAASVSIEDANGNVETGDNASTVTLAIGNNAGPGGVLTCTNTSGLGPRTVASGVASFTGCAITKAGTGYTLTATSNPAHGTATSNSFNIIAGAATQLVFTTSPSNSTTGVAFTTQPIITVEDVNGNTAASTASITLAINSGAGTLSCTSNPLSASGGVASFAGCKITLGAAGSFTLKANATGLAQGLSNSFTVSGAAAKLVITSTPVSGVASSSATLGPITVQEQDSSGNPVNAGGGGESVTLSSNSTGTAVFSATSGGPTTTTVTIPSGSSSTTFFYGDTKAGSPVITVAHTVAPVLTSGSQSETITAGAATKMAFVNCSTGGASCSGQPISVGNNSDLTFNIQTQDSFGNPSAPSVATNITITISNGEATFSVTAGSPASITAPATTSGQVTVHHGVNGGTANVTAHATTGGFADVTLMAKK